MKRRRFLTVPLALTSSSTGLRPTEATAQAAAQAAARPAALLAKAKAGDAPLAPKGTKDAFVKTSEGAAQPTLTAAERRALGEKHGMRFVREPLSPD